MIEDITKENVLGKYNTSIKDFIKNEIDEKHCASISKMPIEIVGVRFRVTLFFEESDLVRVFLVAVEKQLKEKYIGISTREIHENWLKECFGNPNEERQCGICYRFDNVNISSEHDPRSGSDHIIIDYLENRMK